MLFFCLCFPLEAHKHSMGNYRVSCWSGFTSVFMNLNKQSDSLLVFFFPAQAEWWGDPHQDPELGWLLWPVRGREVCHVGRAGAVLHRATGSAAGEERSCHRAQVPTQLQGPHIWEVLTISHNNAHDNQHTRICIQYPALYRVNNTRQGDINKTRQRSVQEVTVGPEFIKTANVSPSPKIVIFIHRALWGSTPKLESTHGY